MLLISLLLLPQPAFSCSCAPIDSVAEELEAADAVFSAQVTKLEVLPSWWAESDAKVDSELLEETPDEKPIRVLKATFAVMKAWKGITEPVVVIRTFADCCFCGTTFAIGQRYLVYAFRGQPDQELWTSVCSRTETLDKAVQDLEELGAPTLDCEKHRVDKKSGRGGSAS